MTWTAKAQRNSHGATQGIRRYDLTPKARALFALERVWSTLPASTAQVIHAACRRQYAELLGADLEGGVAQ